jgi:GT2 family glycosyltransferase
MATRQCIGVVVIGRNEGARLAVCLDSVLRADGVDPANVVYVDSGSGDGSTDTARARGLTVIELPAPHTAARGRNAGFRHLVERMPELFAVQFVDGDTEYAQDWFRFAAEQLASHDDIAAISGMLRERHPERSVYNRMCDVEWNGTAGDAATFGGNVMIRVEALRASGLYDPELVAGEDPELAVRVRKATGKRIVHVQRLMCLHDVAIAHFSEWWRRTVRTGHAYAEVNHIHGQAPERFWQREVRSNWLWGAALPLTAAALAPITLGASLLGLGGAYSLLYKRIERAAREKGLSANDARAYGAFTTLGKVAQAVGQVKYHRHRLRGERAHVFDYKNPNTARRKPQ